MFDRRLIIHFDWILFLAVMLACGLGVTLIYSSSYGEQSSSLAHLHIKQLYWIGLGLVAMFTIISIDYHSWVRYSYLIYGFSVLLLIYLLYSSRGAGVRRWIYFMGFSFQPSEFMKPILVLTLGKYFYNRKDSVLGLREFFSSLLIVGLPLILIVKQPDLGTAITLIPIFLSILFIAGMELKYILGMIFAGAAVVPFVWPYLKPYQKMRILNFFNPESDPLGAGYHLLQSKIAVGSGGFWGKGLMSGTQNRLHFLPAQHTDFIFSVAAEELGFVGAVGLLILLLFIILRSIEVAFYAHDSLGRIIAIGICAMLLVHLAVNVGMAIGLMPVTGLPLPFISYGGSAMLSSLIGVGILLNIRMRRFF
jgi:rod shape determining protein RodA